MQAVKTSFFHPKNVRFENVNWYGPLRQTEQLTDDCDLFFLFSCHGITRLLVISLFSHL